MSKKILIVLIVILFKLIPGMHQIDGKLYAQEMGNEDGNNDEACLLSPEFCGNGDPTGGCDPGDPDCGGGSPGCDVSDPNCGDDGCWLDDMYCGGGDGNNNNDNSSLANDQDLFNPDFGDMDESQMDDWIDTMNSTIDDWLLDNGYDRDDYTNEDGDFDLQEWLDWMEYLYDHPLSSPPPPLPTVYYITVGGDDKHYIDGNQIAFIANTGTKTLVIQPYTGYQCTWFNNGTPISTVGGGYSTISLNTSSPGTYTIRVNGGNNNKLIEVTVTISGKSFIKFHAIDTYDGEYGFDEIGCQFNSIKSDYNTLTIDNKPYSIPWMSLLDGQQSVSVKVEPFLTQADLNSSSIWVEFKSSNPFLKINGGSNGNVLHVDGGSAIQALTSINLECTELNTNPSALSRAFIYVVNNNNQIIGQLDVSCQKPTIKKIAFIYVNTGNGYPGDAATLTDPFVTYLNTKSYNQIFKEWSLQSYPNTVNMSQDYIHHTSDFTDLRTLSSNFCTYYSQHYPAYTPVAINSSTSYPYHPRSGSDPDLVYFLFLTTISFPDAAGASYLGAPYPFAALGQMLNGNTGGIAHEIGHSLNLDHTFPSIPQALTKNFMDYVPNPNMFFYFQWKYSY